MNEDGNDLLIAAKNDPVDTTAPVTSEVALKNERAESSPIIFEKCEFWRLKIQYAP